MADPRKLKIAFVLPCDAPGGGIFVAYRHARYLASTGHEVTILFSNADAKPEIRYFPNMHLPVFHIREARRGQRRNDSQFEFDCLIATWWGTYYEMFRLRAERYVYFVQSDERRFYPENSVLRRLVHFTYTDKRIGFVTEARWIQKMLLEEFGVEAAYAPNGVDMALFHPMVKPLSARGERVRILIEGPGTLPYKRIDLAFRVAHKVKGLNPDVEIWFVTGDGFVSNTWHPDRVFRQVSFHKMPAIYASCDILLKLSTVEGVFGPPLEMMACGGTCVVSNVTGYDEYVVDGENALVVPMDDEKGAFEALEKLVRVPTFRKSLHCCGVKTAEENQWESRLPLFAQGVAEFVSGDRKGATEFGHSFRMVFVSVYYVLNFRRNLKKFLRRLKLKRSMT